MSVQSQKIQGIPGKSKVCHNLHDALVLAYNMIVGDCDFEAKVRVDNLSSRPFPLNVNVSTGYLNVVNTRVEVTRQEDQKEWESSEKKIRKWIDNVFGKEASKRAFLEIFEMVPKVKRLDWWEPEGKGSIVLEAFNKTENRSVLFCVDEARGKSGVTVVM